MQFSEGSGRLLSEANSTLESQKSGSEIDPFQLALADKYGNIVADDDSATLDVQIKTTVSEDDTYKPFFGGELSFSSVNGVFTVSNLEFTGEPNQSYEITFSSDAIDMSKPSNQEFAEESETEDIAFDVTIELRGCIAGESFSDDGKCVTCAENFYSVEVFTEPGDCKQCPLDKASCEIVDGVAIISPRKG